MIATVGPSAGGAAPVCSVVRMMGLPYGGFAWSCGWVASAKAVGADFVQHREHGGFIEPLVRGRAEPLEGL